MNNRNHINSGGNYFPPDHLELQNDPTVNPESLDLLVSLDQHSIGVFISTMKESISGADNIDQLEWRLKVWFNQPHENLKGRQYLDMTDQGEVIKVFSRSDREYIPLQSVVDYCEKHPEDEAKAIQSFFDIKAPLSSTYRDSLSSNFGNNPAILDETIDRLREDTANYRANPKRAQARQNIVKRITTESRFRRQHGLIYNPYIESLGPKSLIANLELQPIDKIDIVEMLDLNRRLTAAEYNPKKPATLINSSLRMTHNFIETLIKSQADQTTLTGALLRQFDKFEENEPLSYSGLINIVNKVAIVARKLGHHVPDLNPQNLKDFPNAVECILNMALKDRRSYLETSNEVDRFELAACNIKLVADIGIGAKLNQKATTIQDLAERYTNMSPGLSTYMINQAIERNIASTETADEALARRQR